MNICNDTTKLLDNNGIVSHALAQYDDGDLIIVDGIKDLTNNEPVRINMFIVLLCAKGRIQVDINGVTHILEKNDVLFCIPNALYNNYMLSPDFEGKAMGISHRKAQSFIRSGRNTWDLMVYLSQKPIYHLTEKDLQLYNYYYELISYKLQNPSQLFHKEIMLALMQGLVYEICALLRMVVEAKDTTPIGQGDVLFLNFLDLLQKSDGRDRAVKWYAGKLCVTPKYLSVAVKAASGKNTLEWIHNHVATIMENELRYSTKSIKEISNQLNFPNLSFFGKFFKSHFNMSPTQFRKELSR